MNIQNVAGQNAVMKQNSRPMQHSETNNAAQTEKHPFATKLDSSTVQNESPIQQSQQPQGNANGVMRLMDEGHFKGVAEVRLRMNFSAQLTSRSTVRAMDYLESESGNLVQGIEERLGEIGTGFNFAEEVQGFFTSFESAIGGMFDHSGESATSPTSIFSQLRDTFTNLFASLQGLSPVGSGESVTGVSGEDAEVVAGADGTDGDGETTVQVDAENDGINDGVPSDTESDQVEEVETALQLAADEPASSEQSFADSLTNLQRWFDEQLGMMQATVNEFISQPQFSGATGNGVAYSRFVGMYAEMSVTASREQQNNTASEGTLTMAV